MILPVSWLFLINHNLRKLFGQSKKVKVVLLTYILFLDYANKCIYLSTNTCMLLIIFSIYFSCLITISVKSY